MLKQFTVALAGILVAFLAGLLILWAQGYPPFAGYASLFFYSILSRFALFSTLNKAAPLILTGLSAAIAFGSGAVNLGQVGQFLMGAMSVTLVGLYVDLPAVIMVPLLIVIALASGALWAGLAAFLRQRYRMDEFVTTLMLNFIAEYFTLYLISGPLLDRTMYSPMTKITHPGGWLPDFGGLGSVFFLAVLLFAVIYFLWNRSKLGYEWRGMGHNPLFFRGGGCQNRAYFTRANLVSGASARPAGAIMVMGCL